MAEDGFYLCTWKSVPQGYTCWVQHRPDVCGSGATVEQAEAALLDAVQNAFGAMRAVFEFYPPLPRTALERRYAFPDLLTLEYDGGFDSDLPRVASSDKEARLQVEDAYYEKPICRGCLTAFSPRSAKPITVKALDSTYDYVGGRTGRYGANSALLFSGDFIALLTDEERSRLVFRPVEQMRRYKKNYFELVGPDGPERTAVRELHAQGWKCGTCGNKVFRYRMAGLQISDFLARDALQNPLPSLFTIGKRPDVELCIHPARWKELVGKKGTKGIGTALIGVVDTEDCINPDALDLPLRDEF